MTCKRIITNHEVRARACGILIKDGKPLLLKHEGLGPKGFIWSPPGGGIEFGVSAEETVVKEFKEETHLDVAVNQYLFACEYKDKYVHAIELFFSVSYLSGELQLGTDPELPEHAQTLTEIRYMSNEEILSTDPHHLHSIFQMCRPPESVCELKGFFKFG